MPETRSALLEALVVGFEQSASYADARDNMKLLERASAIPDSALQRIERAAQSNDQVSESFGVKERVETLCRSGRGAGKR